MSTWGEWLGLTNSAEDSDQNTSSNVAQTTEGESNTDKREGFESVIESSHGSPSLSSSHSAHTDFKQSAFAEYASMVGMDVVNAGFSLPIFCFEPSTELSRMSETFEFGYLMNTAASYKSDPVLKHAYVAAFVVSGYAHSIRLLKPFDSVPGETFQLEILDWNMKYIAEHISNDPSLSVGFCEGNGWSFTEDVQACAVYHGNSLEISNKGHRKLCFDGNEVLTWKFPKTTVNNLVLGSTYIEHHGELKIENTKNGFKIEMEFAQKGWFDYAKGGGVSGCVMDQDGNVKMKLKGSWMESLVGIYVGEDGQETGEEIELWNAGEHFVQDDVWKFTKFSCGYFDVTEDELKKYPPTDSRQRLDVRYLLKGKSQLAGEAKNWIEYQRKQRENEHKSDEKAVLSARYFKQVDKDTQFTEWDYIGDYWDKTQSIPDAEFEAMKLF